MTSGMNTLTASSWQRSTSFASRRLAGPGAPTGNAWYHGFDMGMAFCRVTERLAAQPGTKVEKELRCLERLLRVDFSRLCGASEINLIDLGTGDGQKVVRVLNSLAQAGPPVLRYVPVDTNPHIARYAIFKVLGGGKMEWTLAEAEFVFGPLRATSLAEPRAQTISLEKLVSAARTHSMTSDAFLREKLVVPTKGLEIDFFQSLPKVMAAVEHGFGEGMNFFCLLGNTFGNYPVSQREAFLAMLGDAMQPGDLFLLGVSLRPQGDSASPEEIRLLEREYLPGESFMRLGADDPASRYRAKYDAVARSVFHAFERPDQSRQEMGFSYLFGEQEIASDLEAAELEIVASEIYPGDAGNGSRWLTERTPRYLTILARKPLRGLRP